MQSIDHLMDKIACRTSEVKRKEGRLFFLKNRFKIRIQPSTSSYGYAILDGIIIITKRSLTNHETELHKVLDRLDRENLAISLHK